MSKREKQTPQDKQERKAITREITSTLKDLKKAPTTSGKQGVLHAHGLIDLPDEKIPAFTEELKTQRKLHRRGK